MPEGKELINRHRRWAIVMYQPREVMVGLFLLALLTYLFMWRFWASVPEDRAVFPHPSDLTQVFFPPRYHAAKILDLGQFPLWNPHVYSGYPQFADPQAATFYPVFQALALAWPGPLSLTALTVDVWLHFFLAGAFSYLFFRRVFQSNLPALASAMAFEFGGYLSGYPPLQLSELEAAAWLPAVLWLATLAVEKRNVKLSALAGLAFGQVFLAGRPQSYLTVAPLSVAWLLYHGRHQGLSCKALLVHLTAMLSFGVGISAIQWLPTLQLTRLSTRADLAYPLVSEGGLPWWELAGVLLPRLAGSHNLYVGVLALLLAAVTMVREEGRFWAVVLAVCILGALGKHLILFDALYLIERLGFPGYLRNVERLAFGATFALAALAGLGLKRVLTGESMPRHWIVAGAGILVACSAVAGVIGIGSGVTSSEKDVLGSLLAVAIWLSLAWLAWRHFSTRPAILGATLLALMALDVMTVNQGRFYVLSPEESVGDLEQIVSMPPGRDPFYRVAADQWSAQDFGSLLGVDNVGGLPPLDLRTYRLFLASMDQYRRNILLNVEMVVTSGEFNDPAYEVAGESGGVRYYRFLPAQPRAYPVARVIRADGDASAAAILSRPEFDHWASAVVTGAAAMPADSPLSPEERADVVGRSANDLTLSVNVATERLIVISEAFYPGWTATVDGAPAPVLLTNVALRGVVVPAGEHIVEMEFRPRVLHAGMVISGLTMAAALLTLLRGILTPNPMRRSVPVPDTEATVP